MARSRITAVTVAAVVATLLFATSTEAVRQFHKRSDLENVPPVSDSGYTVPLTASLTCQTPTSCTDNLPSPDSSKTLEFLAIARGVFTFECNSSSPSAEPTFVAQNAELYDVAPLIQILPSEQTLHDLVAELYRYDYSQLKNSTLNCIGQLSTQYGDTTIQLDGEEQFIINTEVILNAPNPQLNGPWIQSASDDGIWEVYQVETVGGVAPTDCSGGQSGQFDLAYAAEYWFYHS